MYKVMLVDDEPFILDGLHKVVNWEEHGLEIVAEARNGAQAWELLTRTPIHLLVTDIHMPQMNGLELLMKIREAELDIKCIVLSGYDDFSYVKLASKLGIENYLLKPVDEEELSSSLLHTVSLIQNENMKKMRFREDQNILKEAILYRWITNAISPSELSERSPQLHLDLEDTRYYVCLMRILKSSDGKDRSIDRVIRYAIMNICMEIIECFENSYMINDFDGDFIILLSSSGDGEEKETIQALLRSCIQHVNDLLKLNVFVTLGSSETDYTLVHQSYRHAKSLIDYSLVLNANTICDFEEHLTLQTDHKRTIEMDLKKLTALITEGDLSGSYAFIDELFLAIGALPRVSPDFYHHTSVEILFHLSSILKRKKVDVGNLIPYSGSLFQTAFQFRDKKDLSDWLKQGICNSIDFLRNKPGNEVSPLIGRVLGFIEDNYASDISLKALSEQFKVNPAYLGQQFKLETGTMFSNYLNQLRVEKAKDLLVKTKLKANEIANQVGYTNANYFYEVFKKINGVYPTQYKREV